MDFNSPRLLTEAVICEISLQVFSNRHPGHALLPFHCLKTQQRRRRNFYTSKWRCHLVINRLWPLQSHVETLKSDAGVFHKANNKPDWCDQENENVSQGLCLCGDFESHLSEFLQVQLQRLHVHVKAQRGHGKQDVLPIDGLPLLLVAALARLWRDEADELAHTLLHTLFGIFGNLWK